MDIKTLERYNPWWRDGVVPQTAAGTVERDLLPGLAAALGRSRAAIILGPRRVGKTVLLHQVAERLIKEGTPPRRVVYLSADDRLLGEPGALLPEVVEYAQSGLAAGLSGGAQASEGEVLRGEGDALRGEGARTPLTYMLVDEVHAVPGWPLLVKRYIDIGEPLVWVLTSSAGTLLGRGSTESLAGRSADFRLLPFSLSEVAALLDSPATPLVRRARDIWATHGLGAVDGERARQLRALHGDSAGYAGDLLSLSRLYLRTGGFPEYLAAADETTRARYFWDNLVRRVLFMDVPAIAEVRNPQLLQSLLHRLLAAGPTLINISDIGREMGTTHITIAEYLRIIEATMLDYVLDRFAPGVPGRQAGLKKSVPVDQGLVAELSDWDLTGAQAPVFEGHLAEIAVHAWLRRHLLGQRITHWRRRDKEVDFVLSSPKWRLPVEVKWRQEPKTRAASGMDEFRRTYPSAGGGAGPALLVTREAFGVAPDAAAGSAARLPLWMLG